jgi:hypothetical protein
MTRRLDDLAIGQMWRRIPTILVAALVVVTGCQRHEQGESAFTGGILLPPRDSEGLEIRAFLSSDTIAPRQPIELMYFVVNGPTPTPFLNHPSVIGVWVENVDGTLAPIRRSRSVDGAFGSQTQLNLPGNSVLGWKTDLRCITSRTHVPGDRAAGCDIEFSLDRPGDYNVIVRYAPPAHGEFVHPEIRDTARLVIR